MQEGPVRRLFICGSADRRADVAGIRDFVLSSPLLNRWFAPIALLELGDYFAESTVRLQEDDVAIFILGDHCGPSSAEKAVSSMVEYFFDRCRKTHCETLVYVRDGGNASQAQRRFLHTVDAQVIRKRFEDFDDLRMNVFASLGNVVTHDVATARTSISVAHIIPMALSVAFAPPREDVVEQMARMQDAFRREVDPHDEGVTFDLGVTLEALDVEKLARVIEPENRFLSAHGLAPLSVAEYLVRHRYADPDGRIYDVAFFMFGKTSFSYDGAVWAARRSSPAEKRVRAANGALTQEDVAKDFGVKRKTIIRWELAQTEDGPNNTSNPYGYYRRLRIDPNLRRAYAELAAAVQAFLAEKRKVKELPNSPRFRVSFERFNEHYARHNAKR